MNDCRGAWRVGTLLAAALIVAACGGDGAADDAPDAVAATSAEVGPTGSTASATVPPSSAPEATVAPPDAEAPPETTADGDFGRTIDPAAFAPIGPAVQEYLDERELNGAALVVVDRDAGIVHEQYWGEFSPDRVSLIASSSKMIVAGVLLHLADRGLLDLDAPVADVADWGVGNPTITPAQLVSNSSGLVGLMPDPAYGPYVCQFLPAGTLQDCAARIFTTPDDDGEIVPPDTEFRYGGGQWQVAGAVAEVASGRSWSALIEEIYVAPCGVDSLGFNNHWTQFRAGEMFAYPTAFDGDPSTLTPTDNPNMEGGAYIDPPDYAALLLMQLRGGRCGETQVLSAEALTRMHGDRTGTVYGSGTAYGMGWFVDPTSGYVIDPGAYGSLPWLDLDAGYGAYVAVEGDTRPGLADLVVPLVAAAMTPP